jgi:hypothetical protein
MNNLGLLVLLPIIAYIGFLLALANWDRDCDWRQAALRAALIWGGYIVLLTEILSLVRAVTIWGLLVGWSIPIVLVIIWFRQRKISFQNIRFLKVNWPGLWWEKALIAGLLMYLGITAVTAWLAPPNTYDSLNYHMSRVSHWAQNHSISHFASGTEIENSQAPGAELMILNFYVLGAGDRLANFIEWLAYLGSIIGATFIASRLGTSQSNQRVVAVFAATIPMGIAQASSTMTDGVIAFWMVCFASELLFFQSKPKATSLIFIGLATGLAFLAKATSVAFLLPFLLWLAIVMWRKLGLWRALRWGLAMAFLSIIFNLGYLGRNLNTFGVVFDQQMSSAHSNELRTWQGVASNIVRFAAINLGTPWPQVNQWLNLQILKVHVKLGVDWNDPRTTSVGTFHTISLSYGETTIGNPAHAVVILVCLLLALFMAKRLGAIPLIYTLVVIFGLVVFAYLFKWQVFSNRYLLPLFVLFSPVVGKVFSDTPVQLKIGSFIAFFLLVVNIPYLYSLDERPLIPSQKNPLVPNHSLFTDSRYSWYFSTIGFERSPARYQVMAGTIIKSACQNVGIMLSGAGAEYPIWISLGAPRDTLRIEWIVSGTPSARYRDHSFKPCAVICEGCSEMDNFNGLPKVMSNGLDLFLQSPK